MNLVDVSEYLVPCMVQLELLLHPHDSHPAGRARGTAPRLLHAESLIQVLTVFLVHHRFNSDAV